MGLYADPGSDRSEEFRRRWTATGRRLDLGKSCLRFRTVADLDVDLLRETLGAFSVVDAYLAVFPLWAKFMQFDLSPYPNYAAHHARMLARPAVRDILTQSGVEPQGGTAEAMGKLLAADTVRWAEVIEKAGIPRQ